MHNAFRNAGRVKVADVPGFLRRPHVVAAFSVGGLMLLATLIQGWRFWGPNWMGGDWAYHRSLINQLMAGQWPLEGPYDGLPAYYPPGFHLLVAGFASALRLEVVDAAALLSFITIPLLPLATYWLCRQLEWSRALALLAAALMTFGGGFADEPNLLFVSSPIAGSHNFFPVYPRDINLVLALVLFGTLVRATRPPGSEAWAVTSGLVAGTMVLIESQSAGLVLMSLALVVGLLFLRPTLPRRRLIALCLSAGIAFLLVCGLWVVQEAIWTFRSGGLSLPTSPDRRLPSVWEALKAWGLVTPFALAGAYLVARKASPFLGREVLLPWAAAPLLLLLWRTIIDPPGDTALLATTRLWLALSQPAILLAAVGVRCGLGLVAAHTRPTAFVIALPLVLLPMLSFQTVENFSISNSMWRPEHGVWKGRHVELELAVARTIRKLGDDLRTAVILASPEDSAWMWYETGNSVVYMSRPVCLGGSEWASLIEQHQALVRIKNVDSFLCGDARFDEAASVFGTLPYWVKVGFDVEEFTGWSEEARELDARRALDQGAGWLRSAVERYDVGLIVVPEDWSRDAPRFEPLRTIAGYTIYARSDLLGR